VSIVFFPGWIGNAGLVLMGVAFAGLLYLVVQKMAISNVDVFRE
jgi:hypothetical protein